MGSPTWRLHTGRPWLSPSSRSLPRTTVQRVSLAKMRRHASTWSSRSAKRARRASGPPTLDERLEPPRVDVLAVAGDVPAAREHQPCARLGVVEHRLRRARRVAVHAARDEHDEHAVAARDRALDDVAVVGRAGHDGDPALELGELADALLAAHGDDLVPAVQRVLDHVLPELAGRADDADPHDGRRRRVGPDDVGRGSSSVAGSWPPMSRRKGGYLSVISVA